IPRLAVAQFVACLTVSVSIIESIPITLIDCSAGIVVLAALFDLLSGTALPRRIPPLVGLFLLLTSAVAVSAVFGYSAINGVTPVIKQLLLIVMLCSLYHLAKRIGVRFLLMLFLACVALHAMYVAMPYIASGGRIRSFGLSEASFDDISMFALPISLAFFLWEAHPRRWLYLTAGLLSTLGLVATQSRAPIVFCAIGTVAVILASLWSSKRTASVKGAGVYSYVRRRIGRIMLVITLAAVLLTLFLPSVFSTAFSRFSHLIDGRLGETIFLRATLWKAALIAFLDHPLLGIGAGSFRFIKEMYPGLTLDPVYFWVRGFSAHNLFFHYLAETGIVGASMLVLLFWKTFSLSRKVWRSTNSDNAKGKQMAVSLALYVVGGLLLFSTFIDAGWMWGQTSYVFVFFAALISRHFVDATEPTV
ncbi:MAG: O-antigen ligase family protein, partial [Candidatus Zixiibacteriota bacterium]